MTSLSTDALQRVQQVRKAVLFAAILFLTALAAVTQPPQIAVAWEGVLKVFGLVLLGVAIVGRAWCSLYIGGRKASQIVDLGPYSLTRNPLYLFNFVGAVGIGAQTGSVVLALVFGAVAVLVFHFTVRREEDWLSRAFGQTYADYCARTPRFWPDLTAWRDAETLEVRPRFFVTTLRDGLAFLLAAPIFEALDQARQAGWAQSALILI